MASPPPSPGVWGGFEQYYRIELEDFTEVSKPPTLRDIEAAHSDEIRADLEPIRPHYHPYSPNGPGIRLTQGLYLAELTNRMVEIFSVYCGLSVSETSIHRQDTDAALFAEGEQIKRERIFFARNKGLREAAIAKWKAVCAVCEFDFGAEYGEIGRGFIEVHHLEPVAQRARSTGANWSTSVDDVRPLCANCHRIVHRQRPPIPLDDLRKLRDSLRHAKTLSAPTNP
jgi:hypothetical protein